MIKLKGRVEIQIVFVQIFVMRAIAVSIKQDTDGDSIAIVIIDNPDPTPFNNLFYIFIPIVIGFNFITKIFIRVAFLYYLFNFLLGL